ncbi:MAG: glucoamylase family protein, partial [Actinocatenispora sp.]
ATLVRYARDTWHSFDAMVDPATGLPADNISGDLSAGSRSGYTSPTNIGGYLWSTVVARDMHVISRDEAYRRMKQTLTTMASLDRNDDSGMFYNWYDPHTGAVVHTWPEDGKPVYPFLSSVDNGWFAASLRVVRGADPRLATLAGSLYDSMDFGYFYDPKAVPDQNVGLLRGGFWEQIPDPKPDGWCSQPGNYVDPDGTVLQYTCNTYDITVTEPRLATYLGIANGQIPAKAYFATHRTFPDSCDWDWLEQKPVGETRTYLGVQVFEGAFTYRGMRIVPSWGGDMFEALMPDLFVPEAQWGPRSWGVNHPLTVRAQIEHGMDEAGYGYWGFSPASDPKGGYRAWGVDGLGMDPGGYSSDEEATNVDNGFAGCRDATNPNPKYGDGVVTPHASFLALPYAPREAMDNLARIRTDLHAYGPGGFYDAVAVKSDTVAKRYLSLDQAMVLGAIGNLLDRDVVKRDFVDRDFERAIRPLMRMEVFGARPRR